MGVLGGRIQLGVAEGAVEGVYAAIQAGGEEAVALEDEMLGGAEWHAAGAC